MANQFILIIARRARVHECISLNGKNNYKSLKLVRPIRATQETNKHTHKKPDKLHTKHMSSAPRVLSNADTEPPEQEQLYQVMLVPEVA